MGTILLVQAPANKHTIQMGRSQRSMTSIKVKRQDKRMMHLKLTRTVINETKILLSK